MFAFELYESTLTETDTEGNPLGHGKVSEEKIVAWVIESEERLRRTVEWASGYRLEFRIYDSETGDVITAEWLQN